MQALLEQYKEKSNWMGFWVLGFDWALIIALVAVSESFSHPLVYLLAVLLLGGRYNGLTELLHDAAHENLFKTRRLNSLLECFYAFPVFQTFNNYSRTHLNHHNRFGTLHDNIHQWFISEGLDKPDANFKWIVLVRPFLGYQTYNFLAFIYFNMKTDAEYRRKIISFVVSLLLLLSIFDSATLLFYYWLVPMLIVTPIIYFWSSIEDHYGTETGVRSTIGSPLHRAFMSPHNCGYHQIHHLYPFIPWYKLPKAHKEIFLPNQEVADGLVTALKNAYQKRNPTFHYPFVPKKITADTEDRGYGLIS